MEEKDQINLTLAWEALKFCEDQLRKAHKDYIDAADCFNRIVLGKPDYMIWYNKKGPPPEWLQNSCPQHIAETESMRMRRKPKTRKSALDANIRAAEAQVLGEVKTGKFIPM